MTELTCPACGQALTIDRTALAFVPLSELRSEIGRRQNALVVRRRGPKPKCDCGKCQRCKMRAYKQAERARKRAAG